MLLQQFHDDRVRLPDGLAILRIEGDARVGSCGALDVSAEESGAWNEWQRGTICADAVEWKGIGRVRVHGNRVSGADARCGGSEAGDGWSF